MAPQNIWKADASEYKIKSVVLSAMDMISTKSYTIELKDLQQLSWH